MSKRVVDWGGGLNRKVSVACVFAQDSGAYLFPQSQPAVSRSKRKRKVGEGVLMHEKQHIPQVWVCCSLKIR